MPALLFETLIITGGYLLVLGVLGAPVLLLFRKWICGWFDRAPWRRLWVGSVVMLLPFAFTLWAQFYSPPLGIYNAYVARHWMLEAAEAPTREEREMRVRRMTLHSEYGAHITWGAIRRIPDVARRCEMWEMLMDTPGQRGVAHLVSEYRHDCGPLAATRDPPRT